MQQLVRAKSAWASLLKPDFSPEASSSLMQVPLQTIEGKQTFAVNPEEVLLQKTNGTLLLSAKSWVIPLPTLI